MVEIVAHRGVRNLYPENTSASIQAALDLSISGVELDLELSKDKNLFVLHQETMNFCEKSGQLVHGNREQTQAWINKLHSNEISSIDAGSWFGPQFAGEPIPSFAQILELDWSRQRGFFEIKDPYYWVQPNPAYEQEIVACVEKTIASFTGAFYLMSFNPRILQRLKARNQKYPLFLLVWRNMIGKYSELERILDSVQVAALGFVEDMVLEDEAWLNMARDRNLALYTYPRTPAYNEPEYKAWTPANRRAVWEALLKFQITGVITDFPNEFKEVAAHL